MNVNKAIVAGNLTRDPETKTTPSGQTVTSFSIATNHFWTDKGTGDKKRQPEYHNIIAWGRLGEIAQEYLKKGGLAYVEGRIQTHMWQDQQGNKKSRTEIIAEKLQLGPRINENESFREKNALNTPEPNDESESLPDEINVEEIPF